MPKIVGPNRVLDPVQPTNQRYLQRLVAATNTSTIGSVDQEGKQMSNFHTRNHTNEQDKG